MRVRRDRPARRRRERDGVEARSVDGPDGEPADRVGFPLEAVVDRLTDRTLHLALAEPVEDLEALADSLSRTDGVGFAGLLDPTTYDREAAAIDAVRSDPETRDPILGAREARFRSERAVESEQRDEALNESQSLAAAAACYAEDVCCVHGPPGTGKTRVLVEVVRRAVDAGDRVLVCADSNRGWTTSSSARARRTTPTSRRCTTTRASRRRSRSTATARSTPTGSWCAMPTAAIHRGPTSSRRPTAARRSSPTAASTSRSSTRPRRRPHRRPPSRCRRPTRSSSLATTGSCRRTTRRSRRATSSATSRCSSTATSPTASTGPSSASS